MTASQPRARRRSWTFAVLPRDAVYRLWFDPSTGRWEVAHLDGDGTPLQLREDGTR